MGFDFGAAHWDIIICEYTLHCLLTNQGEFLLRKIQQATAPNGYNLLMVFTGQGEAFSQKEKDRYFHPAPGYLRRCYDISEWKIQHYAEGNEKSHRGPIQIASKILAKKI